MYYTSDGYPLFGNKVIYKRWEGFEYLNSHMLIKDNIPEFHSILDKCFQDYSIR